jgi:hypothetical protein
VLSPIVASPQLERPAGWTTQSTGTPSTLTLTSTRSMPPTCEYLCLRLRYLLIGQGDVRERRGGLVGQVMGRLFYDL